MIMRYRYSSQGPFVDVHFKREEWVTDGLEKHVFTRLWFNEDGDLYKAPEFFEVEGRISKAVEPLNFFFG